jgi:hypothetical protein
MTPQPSTPAECEELEAKLRGALSEEQRAAIDAVLAIMWPPLPPVRVVVETAGPAETPPTT